MKFKISSIEEMAVRISISGYSDKILLFVKEYLSILHECANQGGFEKTMVQNAMEDIKTKYSNANASVDELATNNRLLFLLTHTFHATLTEKVLAEKLEEDAAGTAAFCPGKLLKEKVLD